MKVIHVPFCFRPDPVGGTEVYVEALAREQQRRGVQIIVAAPARETAGYADAGLTVRRFATSGNADLKSLYGEGDQSARREFGRLVDQERPDIVHLHAFTSAVSAQLALDARKRGVRVIFTYHTPTVSCLRGTLMRWGREVCDGKLDVQPCAGCALHGLGVGRRTGVMLGHLPSTVGQVVGGVGLAGGVWTGLRMTDLVRTQHTAFRSFIGSMDRVVVLCQWTEELLVRNGVPKRKLMLSRHGLVDSRPGSEHGPPPETDQSRQSPLRMAFVGRLHPTKGLETLLRALARVPDARLSLDVFGVPEDTDAKGYADSLRALAAVDSRICFRAPVANDQVVGFLSGYDLLAVPSLWLETGPLVVLEAFAAGIPVIGSKRGGIAELVQDRVNGLLVEPESVDAWSGVLHELASDPELVQRLRAGVRPPRRMKAVADDMLRLYDDVLQAE
ncbi:MAG: glycosyltransferase [Chloroflexota bacterium]|nr:glycosyltransferase [Chloroflexota bacterium]